MPQDLEYPSPPSTELAARLDAVLGSQVPRSSGRRGLDQTTWMPLKCLFPAANVPVLELTYPYLPEAELFAFGQRLSSLRDEGVLFPASGGMTHNLALDFDGPTAQFALDFDAWASDALRASNIDALINFRRKAPAANLAHPDDGAHFRLLLVALGVALGHDTSVSAAFPVVGFAGLAVEPLRAARVGAARASIARIRPAWRLGTRDNNARMMKAHPRRSQIVA